MVMPCLDCTLGCGLDDELSFIWDQSFEPASDDPDFLELVDRLVYSLSRLVQAGQIKTPDDLGKALAALFDLCVSLEYAKDVADTNWVYCPATSPHKDAVLLYPYIKACPRCAALGQVVKVPSHKPSSDRIGHIGAKVLGTLLSALNRQIGNAWQVRQTTRKVFDIDLLLFTTEVLALGEVKASPLIAFPLIVPLEQELWRRGQEDEQQRVVRHRKTDVLLEKAGEVGLYLPYTGLRFNIGNPKSKGQEYPIRSFQKRYAGDPKAILAIIQEWRKIYEGYERKWKGQGDERLRWLTFGCGGDVDDSKNSPGIDRTDDIKKGVYQMLKLGQRFGGSCAKRAIKVVLLSNIHAVRHHSDYLSGLEDVTWTYEQRLLETGNPSWRKVRVNDLIRLYDATIAFTKPHFRDQQLEAGFGLDVYLARLREL